MFWNPVSPVQVSDLVLTGIGIGPLKNMSISIDIGLFSGMYWCISNKDNKISHGQGNSLRNKVKGWVELKIPDPLKPLPFSRDNTKC